MGGTTGQSITLANSIIGVGILAMPFCFQQCGVVLAALILLFMGLVSRLCCYFLLKSAFLARRRNFEFLAFHVFGSMGKVAVEIGIIGFLMGTCIAYFVVVGDLGPQIISKMFNINQSDMLRTSIMVIVSVVCVLPLGLLRNVDSLSNVSAATICFYFCLVIKVISEAAVMPHGTWSRRVELWRPAGVLQCVPIFSMALFCQTQLFEIFESLPSLSLEKMNVVTKNAINICTGVYFTLGVFGYIAFSSHDISGNILMSLSDTTASDVIKLGFVMSVAFSFPLIIFPCRASLYSFLYKKVHSTQHDHIINHSIPETSFRCITVGIIAVSLVISLLIPNIELVLGFVGSTIGVLICIVFPAACFIHVTFKNTNERLLAKGVLILGMVIMVLGTFANLQAAESQIDKYDERYITQDKIDKIVEDFFEKRGEIGGHHLKPVMKEDTPPDVSKLNVIKKDSEVQPPNPVPPESNSNEFKNVNVDPNKINIKEAINNDKSNDILLPEKVKEAAADVASDSHPKNLQPKLNDAKLANGGNSNGGKVEELPAKPASEENKVEKIKLIKQQQLIETMKQHGEEQKELMQEQKEILDEMIKNKKETKADNTAKETKPSNEVKVDVANKEQQLIETIKQHGKEQKLLMQEQKEILDEIIKTKKELQQNNDVESNEAKKIAVESIKQIADMAIKSIGGVTEKPDGQIEDAKADRLEKLTNEAVQEIAKKAVETIEAIQEIKKPELSADSLVANNKIEKIVPPVQKPSILHIQDPIQAMKPDENIEIKEVKQTKREENGAGDNIQAKASENVETKISLPLVPNKVAEIKKIDDIKPHSHSPDEPQSYKVGEDVQIKKTSNELNPNVPLAIALSDQAKLNTDQEQNILQLSKNIETPKDNVPIENVVRQKREALDCTQTISLSNEEKTICNRILPQWKESSLEVLPKVDLNDGLRRFPLDPNTHHIGRSLKNYDEIEKER